MVAVSGKSEEEVRCWYWHGERRSEALYFVLHNFFTQSLSSLCNTWSYHCNLFCSSTKIMSIPKSLSAHYLKIYLLP